VRWRESVVYMAPHGVTRFLEIGAGKVVSELVQRIEGGGVGVKVVGMDGDCSQEQIAK
jgi:[acyl-carrier-protein] S-malonyltransferase